MEIIIVENYKELSQKAAEIFLNQLNIKLNSVFGLSTGSTPVGLYNKVVELYKKGGYDFSFVKTFNLDEYYLISSENKNSYHFFMNDVLFNHINVDKKNIFIPDGEVKDCDAFCDWYEKEISNNPIDLQILGIGENGHIGFNEPGSSLDSKTRLVDLSPETIKINSRFFDDKNNIPRQAITMGIDTILKAKNILFLASGAKKAKAVYDMIYGNISLDCPASALQRHKKVLVILDKDAAELLK
ncbi:glucosamine-6-phosphate deaminase [Candidatus Falkowbacteria bacterium RIFOXYB2_FULL_38_15]|uniref:Glucosamine-6-phosphate deaminase n=1 Tax=Candidatus Falkowbacteria bacterium RIFOXYA2_FULL_38_12 TaxID=1797993 RepID=A0A1F5S203_9BACT|nr:MAG: glucosamine-6-phosphate deaminase [Candidatus Falkowbacteria bacterium RIFOXYA2_FULL_38_12]OGF32549.1 MAG: glucosamine-6-phosphate deaminase [Candidatus Falkowbacteria bacterium RIFOXYB2_FULL_38_15]OGF41985.1 MAG: glucosamine-6-phosphate deaminase [Candidatus Falkowbacteria bacterium RIFOXYD2_FULL_39_16]